MNNLFKVLFSVILVFQSITSIAQNKFEGKVVYHMTYEDLPEEMEMMKAMLPSEMTMFIKGEKTRIEQAMMMGMKQFTIVDLKAQKILVLIDMMGKKMKMEVDIDEEKEKRKATQDDIDIKYVAGEKLIAGYKCKRAEVTSKHNKVPLVIYYTEEISGSLSREYKGLKGFPLEYGHSENGMSVKILATEVSKNTLDDSIFQAPEGYDEMDPAMMEKVMQGM